MSTATGPAPRRRGRRALATLVVLAVALVGVLIADHLLRAHTENRLEEELRQSLAAQDVQVHIGGTLFLPQVFSGRVHTADVHAGAVQLDALQALDVDARLSGIHIREPYLVEHVQLQAVAPVETVGAVLTRAGLPDGVDIEVVEEGLVAAGSLLGVPVEAELRPEARGRVLGVELGTVRLGGVSIDVSELPAGWTAELKKLEVSLDDLPPGVLLQEIRMRPDGVWLDVEGEDLVLDEW
ncbi:MAG TPA: DUF2993 domain-containing protein [Beutenbergiaceae bacterium]|nr:DUF2993 domain-containing protein [Beutenbergiaceae bacterium]